MTFKDLMFGMKASSILRDASVNANEIFYNNRNFSRRILRSIEVIEPRTT